MDLLRRYQKPGGFLQLVQLIETCNPQKKQQLLSSIENESPLWAEEVKKKLLTIDRIFSWDEQTLAELMSRLQDLTLSIAVHGLAPEVWERATKTLGHGQRRRIDDLSKTKNPTVAEISSSFMKIISEIREMISLGYVHLAKVDPDLLIDDDIEERLGKGGTFSSVPPMSQNPPTSSQTSTRASVSNSPSHSTASNGSSAPELEIARLRKENLDLKRELQTVAHEVNHLRTVVAQIKRAVA